MRTVARIGSVLAGGILALGSATTASAAPPGTPPITGCAVGHELLSVATLTEQGYRVPADIDSSGNADGYVCGRPLNAVQKDKICSTSPCTVPIIYDFYDNTRAAH
jgi:hypothetical protein